MTVFVMFLTSTHSHFIIQQIHTQVLADLRSFGMPTYVLRKDCTL